MMYKIVMTKKAVKALRKIDKLDATLIYKWLNKNIDGCLDPRIYGKALKGTLADFWSYRVGCYRVVARINDNEITVLVVNIGHRKEIYKN